MRSADTYRGALRNAARSARRLPEWRETVAQGANMEANIVGRANQANAAREAAAKALVGNISGAPRQSVIANAMLEFYRGEKRTRVVSRIVRDLERQVLA